MSGKCSEFLRSLTVVMVYSRSNVLSSNLSSCFITENKGVTILWDYVVITFFETGMEQHFFYRVSLPVILSFPSYFGLDFDKRAGTLSLNLFESSKGSVT